jgi:hypothetical protein
MDRHAVKYKTSKVVKGLVIVIGTKTGIRSIATISRMCVTMTECVKTENTRQNAGTVQRRVHVLQGLVHATTACVQMAATGIVMAVWLVV